MMSPHRVAVGKGLKKPTQNNDSRAFSQPRKPKLQVRVGFSSLWLWRIITIAYFNLLIGWCYVVKIVSPRPKEVEQFCIVGSFLISLVARSFKYSKVLFWREKTVFLSTINWYKKCEKKNVFYFAEHRYIHLNFCTEWQTYKSLDFAITCIL